MQIANPPPSGAQPAVPVASSHFLSSTEGELTLAVIGLGILIIVAMFFALIIIGTMVLICAGYKQ